MNLPVSSTSSSTNLPDEKAVVFDQENPHLTRDLKITARFARDILVVPALISGSIYFAGILAGIPHGRIYKTPSTREEFLLAAAGICGLVASHIITRRTAEATKRVCNSIPIPEANLENLDDALSDFSTKARCIGSVQGLAAIAAIKLCSQAGDLAQQSSSTWENLKQGSFILFGVGAGILGIRYLTKSLCKDLAQLSRPQTVGKKHKAARNDR